MLRLLAPAALFVTSGVMWAGGVAASPTPPPVHAVVVAVPAPAHFPPETATTTTTSPIVTNERGVTIGPLPAPPPTVSPSPVSSGWGCAAAEAYLASHAAPGFRVMCTDSPGATVLGHEAATCYHAGPCPDEAVIAIADPCPAAYMNEASNSWVALGLSESPLDPYGAC